MSAKWECKIEGCNRRESTRGMCATHYLRWRLGQDYTAPIKKQGRPRKATCRIKGCDKKVVAHNLCTAHYARVRRNSKVKLNEPVRQWGAAA